MGHEHFVRFVHHLPGGPQRSRDKRQFMFQSLQPFQQLFGTARVWTATMKTLNKHSYMCV